MSLRFDELLDFFDGLEIGISTSFFPLSLLVTTSGGEGFANSSIKSRAEEGFCRIGIYIMGPAFAETGVPCG